MIKNPPDDYVTYSSSISVEGEVKEGVTVLINGVNAYIKDDLTFKTEVLLNPGKNLIEITAIYNGQKMVLTRKILLKASFADIKKDFWAKEQIEILGTLGIIDPKEQREFNPEGRITKTEFAMWLVRAREILLPEVREDVAKDVPRDYWGAAYIKAVLDLGLMSLNPDGTFGPDKGLTEEEAIRSLKRFDML